MIGLKPVHEEGTQPDGTLWVSDVVMRPVLLSDAKCAKIGGRGAPTPIGDLGLEQMTQALELVETDTRASGNDILTTGYLKATSGGLEPLAKQLDELAEAGDAAVRCSDVC